MSAYQLKALVDGRKNTILKLKILADEIDKIDRNSKIARVSGLSTAILGTVVAVPLGIATIATGGAAAIPLGIAAGVCAGVGGAGGVTSVGANIGGHFHVKSKYDEAVKAVEEDRGRGQHLLTIWNVSKGALTVTVGGASAVAGGAKVARTVLKLGDAVKTAAKVSKVAGGVGIAIGILLLPMDVLDLVVNSIYIHANVSHEKAEEIRMWVKQIEETLPELEKKLSEVVELERY